jgi:hypothetical protein
VPLCVFAIIVGKVGLFLGTPQVGLSCSMDALEPKEHLLPHDDLPLEMSIGLHRASRLSTTNRTRHAEMVGTIERGV